MEEAKQIGEIIVAAGVIVGLFFTVTKPVIYVTKALAEHSLLLKNFIETFKNHEMDFKNQVNKNDSEHEEIRKHLCDHDTAIQDHELRLKLMEDRKEE